MQVAARQSGFEHVAGVERALCGAGSYHGVYLVYKKEYFALGALNFFDYCLEPLFKLAAVLGAGDQRPQVKRYELFAAQRLRHVAHGYPRSKPLGYCGFADPRFAYQNWVVFGAA